jgi:hypothetical protein
MPDSSRGRKFQGLGTPDEVRVWNIPVVVSILRWQLHRGLVDRLGFSNPFTRNTQRKRVLFISERNPISYAQFFPFFLYHRIFEESHGIEIRELPLSRFLEKRHEYGHELDAVLFQSWFELKPDELRRLATLMQATWPTARIAYLDWFAPTDLRYASILDPFISAYVKKQILEDFSNYGRSTVGDTNLTDYYCRRFSIELPVTQFIVPEHFRGKIVLGSNFEYSPRILQNLMRGWREGPRSIDLHARMATKGVSWYSQMRTEALRAAEELRDRFNIASSGMVSKRQYFAELYDSKLCFSPFGYGEVCWRDFEAMSSGALLLKPDMSHLRLSNNPFKSFETYVPLSWDLRDLREKVEYYTSNHSERISIARNALEHLRSHYLTHQFPQDTARLWTLLGITTFPANV